MAIISKGFTMGAARVHERTGVILRRSLLRTAACGIGLLALGYPATAQTIGNNQTVNVSTIGSGTPNFEGGTLVVDKSGTYANNFVLGAATSSQIANLIDAHGNQGTFSGIGADQTVGVPGNLTIEDTVGGGAVTFTGISTYTGPTTINSGATFAVSGSGSISLSQYVLNNGTFDISGASATAQIISLAGSGNITLGSQTLAITDGGIDSNNVFTGTISGAGSVSITGGIEIIDGTNTYTGGTTITSGGGLQIGDDDTNGSITGNINNAGNLTFARSDIPTVTSTISGAGAVNIENGGVIFTGAQPYTGATTITSGSLILSGSGSISSSASLTDDGTFDISQTTSGASIKQITGTGTVVLGAQTLTISTSSGSSGIFTGVISGTGALAVTGAGTEVLGGTNTYTGGTSVGQGATLQLGDGANTGTVMGNIANAGTLVFDYANAQTYSDVISGAGAVKLISGTLTLSAVQSYTGLTTISGGTLVLGTGADISASQGVADSGTFDISGTSGTTIGALSGTGIVQLGGQTLTVNNASSTSGTFSGIIEGTGGVIIGGGTETLSGTNSYTGSTVINSVATLGLTSLNALATSAITDNGTLDISAATNNLSNIVSVNVSSLSGSGAVTLGSNTLIVTSAAGAFSGIISGTGNLTINGGTETLSGVNTFSGTTTIASGATVALSG
ncbi:MAG TPA: autotransporter-associated beta strand repeat-containing protein, partial [Rhizomicrobium sp.]|nr:autotransporter-associated beta strand repeat-containing protein [Rhizomicrobium sp.]